MGYFNPCPLCGANLDPGEKCDCQDAVEKPKPKKKEQYHMRFAEMVAFQMQFQKGHKKHGKT